MSELPHNSLPNPTDVYSLPRRLFRKAMHWICYNFILTSSLTRSVRIGDLELEVPPSVFHPGVFVTSRMFAEFLRSRNFSGKSVVEVGTGSGILALSAARAGAASVLALDINPRAVAAASHNAETNGLTAIVSAKVSNLFSAVPDDEIFDVVISSPPSFAGEPRDVADRAWHAGPGYRDIDALFEQAYRHLAPRGEMFILLSSDTNRNLMEALARQAGFDWELLERKSIIVESFLIYRLTKRRPAP